MSAGLGNSARRVLAAKLGLRQNPRGLPQNLARMAMGEKPANNQSSADLGHGPPSNE
jgi:hypothetical protein